MMFVMGSVREKPDWQSKVHINKVVNCWRKEMLEQHYHRTQVKYMIAELRHSAVATPTLSPVQGVYQSDNCINNALRAKLLQCIAPLEQARPRDYHPGSGGKVIDLVHPSLYPFVAGKTRLVREEGLKWERFIG